MRIESDNEDLTPRGRSRRRFLLGAGVLAVTSVAGIKLKDIPQTFHPISDLDQLLGFRVLPTEFAVPPYLAGIVPNHPFLWEYADSPEIIQKEILKAKQMPTGRQMPTESIRALLDDRVEPNPGDYRLDKLDKVARLAEQIDLQVDLFDAYNLLHSDRPSLSYPSHEPTSPYLGSAGRSLTERKQSFFTDPEMLDFFQKRIFRFVNHLKGVKGIKVWSVGNEFEASKETLTLWYSKVLPVIREADPVRPIISGVADPNLLDEGILQPLGLSANTIHIYPGGNLDEIMTRYQNRHARHIPLVCQEIGFPRLPGDIAYDWLYSQFLNYTLLRFIEINQPDGWIRPIVTGVGPWKLTADVKESDGYEIYPHELPRVMGKLWTWNDIVEKSIAPASNAV